MSTCIHIYIHLLPSLSLKHDGRKVNILPEGNSILNHVIGCTGTYGHIHVMGINLHKWLYVYFSYSIDICVYLFTYRKVKNLIEENSILNHFTG